MLRRNLVQSKPGTARLLVLEPALSDPKGAEQLPFLIVIPSGFSREESAADDLAGTKVPLDKSEGVVKTEISWAVREHRFLCQRRLRTKTLEISPESLCGGIVPPTIDST